MLRLLRNPRLWLVAFVLGALLAIAVWPRAVLVETGTIVRGPFLVTIDEEGQSRVRDRFVVTAPVAGEVLRIVLRPGDRVRKGDRLATLRPAMPMPIDARTRAEDAVRAAEYAVAEAEQAREVARARVSQARTASDGRDYPVVSPVNGTVLKQYRESQSVVPAGEPLLEIGDPGALEIVADLLSADAVRIAPGAEVLIDQWGGGEVLRGRVRRIEPSAFTKISALGVEEQRVNVIIDLADTSEVASALGDNFRVEVRIVVWKGDSVLTAPPGSLFRQGDGWALYAIVDGRAVLRPVTIGHRNDRETEVLQGIDEGARVVVYPPDTLQSGARVQPR